MDDVLTFRVTYRHRNAFEQSQRNKSLLKVGKPIVLKGIRWAIKYLRGVREVDVMRFEVYEPLCFVPRIPHLRSVDTLRQQFKSTPVAAR